jgi:putative membrane protein
LSPIVEVSGQVMRFGAKRFAGRHALEARGVGQVPGSGPLVLAVRHYHHLLDAVGLLAQVHRPLHIMVGLDWVVQPSTRRAMEGLARMCAWPVTLRTPEDRLRDAVSPKPRPSAFRDDEIRPYQQRAFRQCVELLRLGRAVAIFPEGFPLIDPHVARRPRAELLAPFKEGFARAAVMSARRHGRPVPVVPVGIRGHGPQGEALAFAYGAARSATASTDVHALIAEIRNDIERLSR